MNDYSDLTATVAKNWNLIDRIKNSAQAGESQLLKNERDLEDQRKQKDEICRNLIRRAIPMDFHEYIYFPPDWLSDLKAYIFFPNMTLCVTYEHSIHVWGYYDHDLGRLKFFPTNFTFEMAVAKAIQSGAKPATKAELFPQPPF